MDDVSIPSLSYQSMAVDWQYIDYASQSMADNLTYFLPQEYIESNRAYERRCTHAQEAWVPWFSRLTEGAVGQILRKPVTVSGNLQDHLDDIDLQGNDLNVFIRTVLLDAIAYGKTHLFCEYPVADGIERLDQQIAAGLRPYWVHYDHAAVIGWRTQRINGRNMLSQIRIKANELRPHGEFGEKTVETIKVYELIKGSCLYRLFENTGSWAVTDERVIPLPYIPLATYYTNRTGIMTARPPMLEIARLNVQHFRKSADLDHSLHIAAHPKLIFFGCDPDKMIDMAADRAMVIEEPDAKAIWLSAPSDSFAAQVDRIKEIEKQISSVGLSIISSQKNSAETAQSKMIDRAQGDSMLAVTALGLQDAIDVMLQYHVNYMSPESIGKNIAPECEVNRNFDPEAISADLMRIFMEMQQLGQLSLRTLWKTLKDVLPDTFNEEEEINELDQRAVEEDLENQKE